MATPFNGDLLPVSSGFANLGVDVDSNAQDAFDAANIRPFNHIHLVSGVYHDPLHGQSGVLRFNQQQGAFQVSIDGGLTFTNLSAGGVDSVGVIGGANLTGHVDFASAASGFIAITDTGGVSPIFWAVDHLGLSGLWRFPTQGFNGKVVNELLDSNGTFAQGSILVQGASGILVDIVGQTMTIGPAFGTGFATCYVQNFTTPSITWSIAHNFNTHNIMIQVWDGAFAPKNRIIPDRLGVINLNTAVAVFNVPQSGQAIVMACPNN